MTQTLNERRRIQAAYAVAIAALVALGAALLTGQRAAEREPPQSPGLAAPAFAQRASEAEIIIVETREGGYRVVKTPKGWTMRDRGGYPVRQDAIEALTDALQSIEFGRPMTRDPAKLPRLGLDDPAMGGAGVRVQAQDARGALLADLVIGEAGGRRYVRRASENQAWTMEGAMPDVRAASRLLDMRPFALAPERVARLDVARAEGVYAIVRRSEEFGGVLALAPPFSQRPVKDPAAITRAAAALGALNPVDVTPAPSIAGAPTARVTLQTLDGLAIFAELFDRPDADWVKLTARAQAPERAEEALAINGRAGPWAFALDPAAFAAIAPAIGDLVFLPQPPAMAAPPAPTGAAAPAPAAPTDTVTP